MVTTEKDPNERVYQIRHDALYMSSNINRAEPNTVAGVIQDAKLIEKYLLEKEDPESANSAGTTWNIDKGS